MAIRKINPTTPGQRGMTVSAFEEITRTTPERSLLTDMRKMRAATSPAASPSGIRAAAQSVSTVLWTSSVTRTACPARCSPLSMTPTVPPTSHCSTMQTAKSATSSLLWA